MKIIDEMISTYDEARQLFDPYPDKITLKDNTHKKRAVPGLLNDEGYDVHLEMPLKMSVRELMSASKTKRKISKIISQLLLKRYQSSTKHLVVAYESTIQENDPDSSTRLHSHDEADQLIPNQLIEAAKAHPSASLDVFSPDTDELTMLMNLVATGRININNSLNLTTKQGKQKKQ